MGREVVISGILAATGVAIGPAFVLTRSGIQLPSTKAETPEYEESRVREALTQTITQLEEVVQAVTVTNGPAMGHIFRSQQTIAEDEGIRGEVFTLIHRTACSAEEAVHHVMTGYLKLFQDLQDDAYNRSRGADLLDLYRRIMRNLHGYEEPSLQTMPSGSVLVAEELLPSEVAQLGPKAVAGIVLQQGTSTSHVAIIARKQRIPMIVQVSSVVETLRAGTTVIVDALPGTTAQVHINPPDTTQNYYREQKRILVQRQESFRAYRGAEPVTQDGHSVVLSVNVGSTEDLSPALAEGARRIGLYRSEFVYLASRDLPSEDVQYEIYTRAVTQFASGGTVIRTLDVGGDKPLPGLSLPQEDNPFLGFRGLRVSLEYPDMFRTQLRAILRAAHVGRVQIMFPMVTGVADLDRALEALEEAKGELQRAGVPHAQHLETGVMIEVPSAAFVAEALAKRVSFLSIGTNDLTQYLTATDRLNPMVQQYHKSYDPAVFRTIAMVVEAGHRAGCPVGVCGELGGNPLSIPALLGMGVDELSMSSYALPEATGVVREGVFTEMQKLAADVLAAEGDAEVLAHLEAFHKKSYSSPRI